MPWFNKYCPYFLNGNNEAIKFSRDCCYVNPSTQPSLNILLRPIGRQTRGGSFLGCVLTTVPWFFHCCKCGGYCGWLQTLDLTRAYNTEELSGEPSLQAVPGQVSWFLSSWCCVLGVRFRSRGQAKIQLWYSTFLMGRKGADKLLMGSFCITFGSVHVLIECNKFHFYCFSN